MARAAKAVNGSEAGYGADANFATNWNIVSYPGRRPGGVPG